MLSMKQLEDGTKCKINQYKSHCNKKCSFYYEQELADGDKMEGCSLSINELAQTALVLANMLKKLEWNKYTYGEPYCPICDRIQSAGHKANCKLGALLKGLEGEK
jgi:hypothetical protein